MAKAERLDDHAEHRGVVDLPANALAAGPRRGQDHILPGVHTGVEISRKVAQPQHRTRRGPVSLRSVAPIGRIVLPNSRLTLIQIGIGVLDLSLGALAMYALLPAEPAIDFFTLQVIFVTAFLLGFARTQVRFIIRALQNFDGERLWQMQA